MKKILMILLCLCAILFAESREMRIGDSQYFKAGRENDQTVKVTLVGVQNGVAILKKERVENTVPQIDYFYMAPTADVIAPIEVQPYPSTVYSTTIEIRGICEPGYGLYLYKAKSDKLFDKAVRVLSQPFSYNGSNFSVNLPLEMGDNTYFISYEGGVVGNRAEVNVTRVSAPSAVLDLRLDPIGNSDIRKTSLIVSNAKYGSLDGYESIMGKHMVRTTQNVDAEGNVLFVANNTYNDVSERAFDVSLFDHKNDLVASNTIVVPVSEERPVCSMSFDSPNFTPSHSLTGSFEALEGVRFVWARVLDYSGEEYSRSFFDLAKMESGIYTINYNSLSSLKFQVFDKNQGLIRENSLNLPEDRIKAGYEYYLEIGATNIAGNRSNTYIFNLFEAEFEKLIDIPLDNAVPTTDVVDYPVLVQLNQDNFDFSKALENGDDIVFADIDGKKLYAEKERFSREKKKAEFWVKVPLVRAYSSRIRLRVRWSNPLASASDGTVVWNDSYKGIYHFNEEFRGPYVIPQRSYSKHVIYTTGSLTLGDRSELNGSYQSNGSDEIIVEPLPVPGSKNVKVLSGGAVSLAPGSYGDLLMGDNCKLNLVAGTYHFSNVTIGNDAKIFADVSDGVIAVKVLGNLRAADRTSLKFAGKEDPSAVRFDVTGSEIKFGYDTKWNAVLTAPLASVSMLDRSEWNGAIYAHELITGMDVIVNAAISQDVYAYTPNDAKLFPPKTITGFALYAKKNLVLNGQSRLSGSIGSEKNIVVAEGTVIDGDVLAWENVELRSQSSLSGSLVVGGLVETGYNVSWNGSVIPLSKKNQISLGDISVQIGTKQAVVQQGKVAAIDPGTYESLIVEDGAKALLLDGAYHFGSIMLKNNASLEMDDANYVEIYVSGSVVAEHGVKVNTNRRFVMMQYAGTSEVRFGNDCVINATLVLPYADFSMGDRSSLKGFLAAQNVTFGYQTIFSYGTKNFPDDVRFADASYPSDWIVDASNNANNGSPRMAFAEDSYIANNEFFGLEGCVLLKGGNYFKNHEGTISAWVYFDGAEGKFMASSDDVVPDWSMERTLEGHVVFKAGSASMLFPVPEQSWAYLTFAVSGTRVDAYLNGEFVKSLTISALDDFMTPWVGVTGDGMFKIDELRFMNKALSKEWIRMDYVTQKMNKNEEGVGEYALAF